MKRYIRLIVGKQTVMMPGPHGMLEPREGWIERQFCLDDFALVFRMPGGHTPTNRALVAR